MHVLRNRCIPCKGMLHEGMLHSRVPPHNEACCCQTWFGLNSLVGPQVAEPEGCRYNHNSGRTYCHSAACTAQHNRCWDIVNASSTLSMQAAPRDLISITAFYSVVECLVPRGRCMGSEEVCIAVQQPSQTLPGWPARLGRGKQSLAVIRFCKWFIAVRLPLCFFVRPEGHVVARLSEITRHKTDKQQLCVLNDAVIVIRVYL
jgi:hypothetical protein